MNHTINTPERQLALLQAVLPRRVTRAEVEAHRELFELRAVWRFRATVVLLRRYGFTLRGDGAGSSSVGGCTP